MYFACILYALYMLYNTYEIHAKYITNTYQIHMKYIQIHTIYMSIF